MGPRRGYLGASFILEDWRVRVIWSSGLVDRPSKRMYVHTITLSGCMERRSRYTPFYSQSWLSWHSKPWALAAYPEELPTYGSPRWGPLGTWTFSDKWTAWDVLQTKTVSSKNWKSYNLGERSTLITRFYRTQQMQKTGRSGFLNSPGDFFWLESPRWATTLLRG